uniref:Peptidase S1 domain-containing protein n=1 Tax=Anopheles christyi TaxID=43041 RepID=A0A182JTR3_9DIPT
MSWRRLDGVIVLLLLYAVCCSFAQSVLQYDFFSDSACGKRLVKGGGLVKGGYSTRPGDWPWHVALYQRDINSDGFEYACGGSIVHRYLVLTAAHCVTFATSRRIIPNENLLLKMGRFNLLNEAEEYAEEFNVMETIVHRGYRPTTFENDIALLRVEISIIFNNYIQPVCIWKRDDGFILPNVQDKMGTVVGWGLSDDKRVGTVLNEAKMPIVDSYTCLASDRTFFGKFLYRKAFCAGFKNGTGVCNGDSGGGMFFQFQNQWYLKGVVSFSNAIDSKGMCNLKQYIGFTDASQYIDWLYENTPNRKIDDPILGHPNIRLINQDNCGRNNYGYDFDENLKPVIARYPWMVTIRNPLGTFEYVPCNGVLLNRNYVLTTSCIYLEEENSITLGDYDTSRTRDCLDQEQLQECTPAVQTVSVEQLFRKDDLVLVRLSTPAFIGRGEHIEAICLPVTPQQRERLYNRYIMTGWKESGANSTLLHRELLEAIDVNKCRAAFQESSYQSDVSERIDSRTICALNLNDPSRSPQCNDYQPGSAIQAIDKETNRYLLYGVQTGISYCTVPEQYIAISKYMEWILDNIRT